MTIDIEAIKTRAEAATRGPWGNSDGTIGVYIEGDRNWTHVATVRNQREPVSAVARNASHVRHADLGEAGRVV